MAGLQLPRTDAALVDACAAELAAASTSAADTDVEAARLRFAWALAHSASPTDTERALELLNGWLASDGVKGQRREALYLSAVAHYRRGRLLEARRCADAALAVSPSCHQSAALKAACEETLAEDALLAAGVGIVGGVLAAVAIGLLSAGKRRRT